MLDQYRELIDELLGAPGIIRGLAGSGDISPDGAALIAGTRDRDLIMIERLNTIMRSPDPRLGDLKDAAIVGNADGQGLLDTVDTARGDLVSILMNLTLKDWERTAFHDTDGEISLSEEVERHVDFDEAQVARIRAALA
jgi:hypothetical protein